MPFFETSNCLGVADGVGGWKDFGVDPALYAQSLMNECHKYIQTQADLLSPTFNLLEVLQHGDTECKDIKGSSTALLVFLNHQNNKLTIRNCGDSRCLILRFNEFTNQYQLKLLTQEQQHRFNLPFQLGTEGDKPEQSIEYQEILQENDLVILGTDGLYDNLFVKDILEVVNKNVGKTLEGGKMELKEISEEIADKAFRVSVDPGAITPWVEQAKCHGMNFIGGKSDDITVLVAKATVKKYSENVN